MIRRRRGQMTGHIHPHAVFRLVTARTSRVVKLFAATSLTTPNIIRPYPLSRMASGTLPNCSVLRWQIRMSFIYVNVLKESSESRGIQCTIIGSRIRLAPLPTHWTMCHLMVSPKRIKRWKAKWGALFQLKAWSAQVAADSTNAIHMHAKWNNTSEIHNNILI